MSSDAGMGELSEDSALRPRPKMVNNLLKLAWTFKVAERIRDGNSLPGLDYFWCRQRRGSTSCLTRAEVRNPGTPPQEATAPIESQEAL